MEGQQSAWSALESMLGDLRRSLNNVTGMQRRLLSVTGTAWSSDRTIKAVVGPRGQLIELEIDPRIYRKPNSKALAATIVATVREAVDDVLRQTSEVIEDGLPQDSSLGITDSPTFRLARRHDADVVKEMGEDDE